MQSNKINWSDKINILKTTKIPHEEGLLGIGDYAFKDCFNLEKINIPQTVKYIGKGVFNGCEKLHNLINDSPVLFDWWVHNFKYNDATLSEMAKVDLAKFVNTLNHQFTILAKEAFAGCHMLKEIVLHEFMQIINSQVFLKCFQLEKVTFKGFCDRVIIRPLAFVQTSKNLTFYVENNVAKINLSGLLKRSKYANPKIVILDDKYC